MRHTIITLCIVLCLAVPVRGQPGKSVSTDGFILPSGFSITEVAGPELANDIYCITFSPQGHLVVSGRGYLKQLIDDQSDGIYDRAVLLAAHPKDGSMGMLIEQDQFYFMGDGGLRRMAWKPGASSDQSELLIRLKTGGEHDAHAISRGPDGWLYLLCGNTAGVTDKLASLPTSPIKKHVAGCVLRVSPDHQQSEILCDGFRNAYGFDWSLQGELYTYDSDNERCLGLPWYEGCRFYRIIRGGHYGWRSPQLGQFWRIPPYYAGYVGPELDLGRGSPTGVVCNRHQQFPMEYDGVFFVLDWTFGIIHCVQWHAGAPRATAFLKVAPGHGFAPSSAAMHPLTGDLYVSSGGRGTRGAVYRIRHEAGYAAMPRNAVLRQPRLNEKSVTLREPPEAGKCDRESLLKQLQGSMKTREQLELLCRFQSELGAIGAPGSEYAYKEGYAFKNASTISGDEAYLLKMKQHVRKLFPTGDHALNRELSRTMALLKDDDVECISKLLGQVTATSSPIDDVHYLFVLACCPARRTLEQTQSTANALVQLDQKYERAKWQRERNWSLRMAEAVKALCLLDPKLPEAVLKHPDVGRPDHLLLVEGDPGVRLAFARRWLAKVEADPEYPWSAELVKLLSLDKSPATTQLLRKKWDDPLLQDAILPALAREANAADRPRFLASMRSLHSETVVQALEALEALPLPEGESLREELVHDARGLRYWEKTDKKLGQRIAVRLHKVTSATEPRQASEWYAWIVKRYPDLQGQLEASDGIDRAKWDARLSGIDWKTGRVTQGEAIYRQHCAACHQGTTALGPDLAGIGKRFNHDDLITAILQPSKDVPARYRTSLYTTHSGQTISGLVIYEAVDGIILQTATNGAVRIAGNDIAGTRTSDQSLMPAGLLDRCSNQQIADLMAWLKR